MRLKINKYVNAWENRCYLNGVPDEADERLEAFGKVPSYRRICKAILKNDLNVIGIASQIDMICKNSLGEYFKFDWKTNEKIETNGYRKYMLPPFNLYPDAAFYHYSTQLSFYDSLCTEYQTKGKFIVHIGSDNYNIIKAENIPIPHNVLNQI